MGFWGVVNSVIRKADIILLIGDARMPELSMNEEIERKMEEFRKPFARVFNKIDLLSEKQVKELKKKYPEAFFVSGIHNTKISDLRRSLLIMAKRMKIEEPIIGVVGYPNLGKSAVINALAHRARTQVADRPGTTKGVQWVKAGSLRILDTPGVIPYEDKSDKLTLLGSKSPEQINNPERAASKIIALIINDNKSKLEERYGIDVKDNMTIEEIIIEIGRKRGFLKKAGEVDETKTAITIIREWQKGRLRV